MALLVLDLVVGGAKANQVISDGGPSVKIMHGRTVGGAFEDNLVVPVCVCVFVCVCVCVREVTSMQVQR